MLVLSRKHSESVVIGAADGLHRLLKVTVLGIEGADVKLGFEVDPDVPVHRSEMWEHTSSCMTVPVGQRSNQHGPKPKSQS